MLAETILLYNMTKLCHFTVTIKDTNQPLFDTGSCINANQRNLEIYDQLSKTRIFDTHNYYFE